VIHITGSNNVVLDPYSTQTIDGDSTYTFSSTNSTVTVVSDGSNLRKSGNVALGLISGATITLANTGLHILDTNASHDIILKPASNVAADRTVSIYTGDVDTAIFAMPPGGPQRSKFRWKDADEIYIGAGVYFHAGTKNQFVYWDSELTFKLQAAGSNLSSDDYGADGWHYIYLDDSAIVTQGVPLLDADCFISLTGANADPVWSVTKRAWVGDDVGTATPNDRCIFAVYETGGAILEFWHDGGDYVEYGDLIQIMAATADDAYSAFADIGAAITMPGFSTKANITVNIGSIDATSYYRWRTNGSGATNGHRFLYVISTETLVFARATVMTDENQMIEIKADTLGGNTIAIDIDGWYFPVGM